MQITIAALVCLVQLVLQTYAQPYRRRADDFLALVCSFLLAFFFFTCASPPTPSVYTCAHMLGCSFERAHAHP
jgi:hypothetical protein